MFDARDKPVEDLRERMRLLQSDRYVCRLVERTGCGNQRLLVTSLSLAHSFRRRANIDLSEARKVANCNEIQSLKEDNKRLRARLSDLQKAAALDHDRRGSDIAGRKIQKLVLQKRNEYNSQKAAVLKLESKMDQLKDEAKVCRLEEKRPSREDGPLSRQITTLEGRLDRAMVQYNEAHGILSTYQHIVKRLQEERVCFDNQLTALERTLESKQKDCNEMLLLSGDASHAKEIAMQTLQKAKWEFEDDRTKRTRDIRDRQQHVRIRQQMIKKHHRLAEEKRKALSTADAAEAESASAPVPIGGTSTEQQMADQELALNIYETAFRKIKEVVGVESVSEVTHKVVSQEATTDSLNDLTLQNQGKIEDLTRIHSDLLDEVEKVKLSMPGVGTSKSGKSIDEQQETLYLRQSLLERTKSQYDRLALVMVSIKAGVEHLQDKLVCLPRDEFDHSTSKVLEGDEVLPEAIRKCGDALVNCHNSNKESELRLETEKNDERFDELKRFGTFVPNRAFEGLQCFESNAIPRDSTPTESLSRRLGPADSPPPDLRSPGAPFQPTDSPPLGEGGDGIRRRVVRGGPGAR